MKLTIVAANFTPAQAETHPIHGGKLLRFPEPAAPHQKTRLQGRTGEQVSLFHAQKRFGDIHTACLCRAA